MILLRYSGEVSTKARPTRRHFETCLVRNVRDALGSEGVPAPVERSHERILVKSDSREALEVLARVSGLQSVSLAVRHTGTEPAAVTAEGARVFGPLVHGLRYAVRARRVGNHPSGWRPRQLECDLGAALEPGAAGVDLDHPEFVARVESWHGDTFFCVQTLPGPGGLPLAAEGRALALVSGGFDSAVAAWMLLNRGVRLDYVFCNLGGRTHELGVLRVMKVIAERWSYGHRPLLHVIDFAPVVAEIQAHARTRYWQVLLKRFMLRAAERIAREGQAEAIVTGEAVGQVSSQTLTNLAAISEVTELPILRPLVGFNKNEIIERARALGTADLSAVVGEYCAMVPRNPATAARAEVLREEELALDLGVLHKLVGEREEIDLRALDPDSRGLPELEVAEPPPGAQVIDLRSRAEYTGWHHPGAVHLDFAHALRSCLSFAPERSYVLYCDYGLKSAHLAEVMRRAGLQAWHVKGGTRALRRLAEGD